jgi:DNA-directed RNA polymerase subunit K/omega
MRVAHGIYYYPKINTNKYIKSKYLSPSVEEIAYGIAKRDKVRIVPTGTYALNALGLSTQIAANVVFITDGAPRRISVGKGRGILFKHTSEARSLAYKSKLLMLIVSALREIGEDKATPQQLEIIKNHLSNVSQKELNADIQLMPIWVRKIILSL